jgi:hypothetical protein
MRSPIDSVDQFLAAQLLHACLLTSSIYIPRERKLFGPRLGNEFINWGFWGD